MANFRLPEINKVILIGRATKDTRLLLSVNKNPYCMITVANNRNYKDKNGEWKKQTSFINVKISGMLAQNVCELIKKGTAIYIEGSIETYKKDDGEKYNTNTVIRAQTVRILSSGETEEEYSPPDINVENNNDLPPVGGEDEELPF